MIDASSNSHDQVMGILFDSDEITWQSMIYELVSNEQMDPWNIDVLILAHQFLDKLKKIKEMDLKVSGKVLLAAAILLRVKSYRFLEEDMSALDSLIASANEPEEEFFEDLVGYDSEGGAVNLDDKPEIYPRTPQPRKRKVSVFDLVNALEKALNVFKRRPPKLKDKGPRVVIPQKGRDISMVIREVHNKIVDHFESKGKKAPKLMFNHLLNDESKEEKIFTFIPLLHLDNQRKIDVTQKFHFGDISIDLLDSEDQKENQ